MRDAGSNLVVTSAMMDRVSAAMRGVRRSFARDNLISNLKTLLAVAPLTALIWIYAEQQQLVTEQNVPMQISLVSADPAHRMVKLMSPPDGTLQVTLYGPQLAIDRCKTSLRDTIIKQPLEIDIGNGLPPGERQPLIALDQIVGNKLFASQGVTVTACTPETLSVQVDTIEEKLARVVPPPDVPGLVKAVFEPASVTLRGPRQLMDDLRQRGELVVIADLANEATLKEPGVHVGVSVRLIAPPSATLIPDTVKADLTVGQADQTIAVSPVPVKVLATKYLTDTYKFDYKDVLTDPVVLIGPPEAIATIDPRNAKLVAVVDLENSDATFHGTKAVTFEDKGLPEGVRVKAEVVPRMVQVNVDPR